MQRSQTRAIQTFCFFRASQHHAFAFGVNTVTGHVVQTQYNVLRRNMIGSPFAGDRMLLVDIISARASSWASMSAVREQPSGHHRSRRYMPHKPAGAAGQLTFDQYRFKCRYPDGAESVHGSAVPVRGLTNQISQTTASSRSTIFFAALMVVARPRSSSLP